MKLTIIYDNTVFRQDLRADWGFAALVEAEGKKILFDTGANGSILLSNMYKLDIDPGNIDEVFISHSHFDHTGGLSAFLDHNNTVKVYIPSSYRVSGNVEDIIKIKNPLKLHDGIYSTGELDNIEQSLCIQTKKGIIIIAGCSHPRMEHIINAASAFGSVYGIIGGLHGNMPESLSDFNLICATHCTQYKQEISYLYPEKYIEGGAGRTINITDEISVS